MEFSPEFKSIVSMESQNLTNNLRDMLIKTEIPIASEKDPDCCITIFVIQEPKAKSKSKKRTLGTMHFQYCCDLQFNRSKITPSTPICDLKLIWQILKPECYQTTVNLLSNWCRRFFTTATHFCEEYNLTLSMVPFEVFFDANDNLFVSRLPEFTDLRFYKNSNNSYKFVDATDFLIERATSIIEVSKSFEKMKSVSSTESTSCASSKDNF